MDCTAGNESDEGGKISSYSGGHGVGAEIRTRMGSGRGHTLGLLGRGRRLRSSLGGSLLGCGLILLLRGH